MKVSVPKDFGNTSKKPVLPLVPEPIKSIKKEDLAAVNLCSDPGNHASTQVKFSFKGLDRDHETPHEILEWRRNVERSLTGLDLNAAGLAACKMCKQFMRGSALSSFIAKAGNVLVTKKAEAIVTAELVRDNYPAATDAGHIVADFGALHAAVVTAITRDPLDHLTEACGPTFHATGTPILHVEASFISVERGLRRGISSRTSLKCYIHFSFILKLTIFICKQLKRPVAFSAVQRGTKKHSARSIDCRGSKAAFAAAALQAVALELNTSSMWRREIFQKEFPLDSTALQSGKNPPSVLT